MRISFIIGAILLALAVILAMQQWSEWFPGEVDALEPSTPIEQPASGGGANQESIIMAPRETDAVNVDVATTQDVVQAPLALDESDHFLRTTLSDWGLPEIWSAREELVSRLAVVVLNTAQGNVAKRQFVFLAPASAFEVEQIGELLFIDSDSYARYDPLVDKLTSVSASSLASVVRLLLPLLQQAMLGLGENRDVGALVHQCLDRVIALPEVEGNVEVLQPKVMYVYANERLEALPAFEKQMLRLGVHNVRRLKAYVEQLKKELAVF